MASPLSERIERNAKVFGNRPVFLENGSVPVPLDKAFLTLLRFAECLADAGVEAGDHVVVATRDVISVTLLKLALMRIGATPIAAPAALAGQKGPVRVDRVVLPRPDCSGREVEIPFDQAWIRPPSRFTPITPGGRIIHATSGTTGTPKLRRDTEETLLSRINNGLQARGSLDGPVLVAQNVGSLIGIKSVLTGLLELQPVMGMQGTPEDTVHKMAENRIAHAFIPPLHLDRLVRAAEATGVAFPDLKRINVGGGAIDGAFAERCERVFDCEIYTDYGSTETDTIASYRASLTQEHPGLVGPIWDRFEYRFRTLDGAPSDPAEGGELFLRVPQGMQTENYPDPTPLFDKDGWTSTGDMGYLTEDGGLVLSGRKSDLINVGGNKLSPAELEQAARRHSAVADVAAFRVPTPTGIDAIGFAVVSSCGFDADEFRSFLSATISDLYDFRVIQVTAIPLTEAGKTDRKALAAAAQNT